MDTTPENQKQLDEEALFEKRVTERITAKVVERIAARVEERIAARKAERAAKAASAETTVNPV